MSTERKLHSNWRSRTDTPSLSPTVVAGLRVRYSRHRSSPETFLVRIMCSWTDLFVMKGVREPRFHCTAVLFSGRSVLREAAVALHWIGGCAILWYWTHWTVEIISCPPVNMFGHQLCKIAETILGQYGSRQAVYCLHIRRPRVHVRFNTSCGSKAGSVA
jgi:hypothetical protein